MLTESRTSPATTKKTIDRVVFLDFDGVCTSLKEGSYLNFNPDQYGPSKTCVGRIIKLCERTGAGIVISSNWRKFRPDGYWTHGGKDYYNPLPKLRAMIGKLEVAKLDGTRGVSKLRAITDFLNSGVYPVSDFVVIDDDPDENLCGFGEQYFQTDPRKGITDREVRLIEEYFG